MSNLPLIILIDLDGSCVSDVRPQLILYEMNNQIRKQNKKISIFSNKYFIDKLNNGIIRSYFEKFLKKLKEHYSNIEYFIYTASEKNWANYLVPQIEKSINFKFNRPIFTRQNCLIVDNNMQKSVQHISPFLFNSLKKKYGKLRRKDLENNVLIIDNLKVYLKDDINKMVICPTYDYKVPENIPSIITERIFNNYTEIIITILNKYYNNIYNNVNNYIEFQKIFYNYYINYLTNIEKINKHQVHDKFFLYLTNIILYKQINHFSPNVIGYINNKIHSKISKESNRFLPNNIIKLLI